MASPLGVIYLQLDARFVSSRDLVPTSHWVRTSGQTLQGLRSFIPGRRASHLYTLRDSLKVTRGSHRALFTAQSLDNISPAGRAIYLEARIYFNIAPGANLLGSHRSNANFRSWYGGQPNSTPGAFTGLCSIVTGYFISGRTRDLSWGAILLTSHRARTLF